LGVAWIAGAGIGGKKKVQTLQTRIGASVSLYPLELFRFCCSGLTLLVPQQHLQNSRFLGVEHCHGRINSSVLTLCAFRPTKTIVVPFLTTTNRYRNSFQLRQIGN
jgi:hypothetical protein